MVSILGADFFAGNRRKFRGLVGEEPIVITANGLLLESKDTTFKFSQDRNFWYLTGIDEPDLVLVMTSNEEYLIVPNRTDIRMAFDGALDFSELAAASGIIEIIDPRTGWQKLKQNLAATRSVATLAASPSYISHHYGFYSNPARARLIKKLKSSQPDLKISDVRAALAELRSIKQPAELAAIQSAIDVTAEGIAEVRRNIKNYHFEYEIEAELSKAFRVSGAAGHAFDPIVAAGRSATTIHHLSNNSKINLGDLILLDVGAGVDYYAADISRVIATAEPTERQRQIYEAVMDTQNYALAKLKPGVIPLDYEKDVARYLGNHLVALGVIKDNTEASVRERYPQLTSHFLGLDIHDVGDYKKPLAENMVLTCEPGIYIPEEGIGVRIEDDVVITKTGNRVLSKNLSREL